MPPLSTRHSFTCAIAFAVQLAFANHVMGAPLADFMKAEPKLTECDYKTAGDASRQVWYAAPSGLKPGERRPAVVCIHGGAWVAGGADVFFPHARYFASRGAVGISINYRLVKPDGPFLADAVADCKSAIRYIRSHSAELGVDPERIAVLGDSAGGHLAAALGTLDGFDNPGDDLKVSSVPNLMILCNPIVDMTEGDWGKFVIAGKALDRHATPAEKTLSPAQLELARKLSPLFNVRKGQPATLLMHGLDDHVVTPEQARKFTAAMKEAGNSCDLVLLEGSRHAFILTGYTAPEPRVVDAIRTIDQFFASHGWLNGAPTLEASNPPAWPDKKPAKK